MSFKKLNLALSCPVDVAVESITLKEDSGEKSFQGSYGMVNILVSYPEKRGLIFQN